MHSAPPDTPPAASDVDLARRIAAEAGALLVAVRDGCTDRGKLLGDRGDREANALILERLRAERPGDCILSEEAADDLVRCDAERVWIVDPLDGTRDYSERGPDWAVHVGLAIGGRPVVGAVALPDRGTLYATDDAAAVPGSRERPVMVASRTRAPALVQTVAAAIGAEMVPMGSAGAKAMAVVEGRADIYLHAGGQYEWDSCAPVAVALAAGLHASRIDGSALVYNRREVLLPDLLICRPEWAARVLAAVAEAG